MTDTERDRLEIRIALLEAQLARSSEIQAAQEKEIANTRAPLVRLVLVERLVWGLVTVVLTWGFLAALNVLVDRTAMGS